MSYARIVEFGSNANNDPNANPLSYCMTSTLDNNFLHTAGENYGPYSRPCQMFMSDYCAQNWNGVCEVASKNINNHFPDTGSYLNLPSYLNNRGASDGKPTLGNEFSQGELLIRNTAMKKYISAVSANCALNYQPFDPLTPTSPLIGYWNTTNGQPSGCIPIYEVNPKTIDDDPVMDKLLQKPSLGIDILVNIYNHARYNGTIEHLRGTKLWNFYQSPQFQQYVRSSQQMAQFQAYGN